MTASRKPNEILMVIDSSATLEGDFGSTGQMEEVDIYNLIAASVGGFSSTGRLQEMSINHIDYEMCNDPVDFVMLCAGVPGADEES
jgi:hypothetical protein